MSTTIKLHEATKQFKITNKFALFFLEKIKLPVKSHSSVITVDQLESLREFAENPKKYSAIVAAFGKTETTATGLQPTPPAPPAAKPEKKKASEKNPAPVKSKQVPEKKKDIPKKAPEKKAAKKSTAEKAPAAKKPAPEKKTAPVKAPDLPALKTAAEPKKNIHKKPESQQEIKPLPVETKKAKVQEAPQRPEPQRLIRPAPAEVKKPRVQEVPRRTGPPVVHTQPLKKEKPPVTVSMPVKIQITDFCTVKELAEKLNIKSKLLEENLAQLKMNYLGNQIIDKADIEKLCAHFQVAVEILPYEDYVFQNQVAKSGNVLTVRPPVVTVMGHVDHGKTTLLDTLRKTRVAEKEAGGITQKIGAYKLQTSGGTIIFIDTPGHEAFTNLRARGAKVTDLVILVVAANDGVQPQTIEAIHHAQAAQVPIIVAINKIDIQGTDSDKIKQDLSKHDILVEAWGGKVVSVEISAKFDKNLDLLLEMIQLVAQMQELKAYVQVPARGTIIESRLDPQLGPIGTVLIQHGQLRRGDYFICGNSLGKIKSIFDDTGKTQNSAQVPDPIEIMGFEALPEAGDIFQVVEDLEKAKKVIEMRQISQKAAKSKDFLAEKKLSLQNLFQMVAQNKIQVFPLIVKADNFGSAEVLSQILARLSQDRLKIEIVHSGLGNITESDILLASTSGAIIIGFNVKAPQKTISLAKMEKVEIKLYNVIYHLVEDIEKAVKGKIGPQYQEARIGKVEILQKFKISKVGMVAGCIVRDGKVTRKSKIKIMRGEDLVFEGEIESLKRIKDEMSEVKTGTECGIRIKNFNNIEIGDILEIYETSIVP